MFHEPYRGFSDWKSTQIASLLSLSDSLCALTTAIEAKHAEIASLRKVVCDSARLAGRTRPQMTHVAELMEVTFALTSPCHLGTARSVATDMDRMVAQAITSLRALPDGEAIGGQAGKALGEKMEEVLGNAGKTTRTLSQLLINAENEVQTLQTAFVEFSL